MAALVPVLSCATRNAAAEVEVTSRREARGR